MFNKFDAESIIITELCIVYCIINSIEIALILIRIITIIIKLIVIICKIDIFFGIEIKVFCFHCFFIKI